jgi:thioesterase domain-containing protein/acyl carrier protein
MVEHLGVCNVLTVLADRLGWRDADRFLQKTTFTFDLSVLELFAPLVTGSLLTFAEPGRQGDSAYLIDLITRDELTVSFFVPSMLRVFLDHPDAGRCTSMRHVLCSGEAMTPDLVERFAQVMPWAELHNMYGPTEASVEVTVVRCEPGWTGSIGAPIRNTRVYVLDHEMRPLPAGIPGELLIGGPQVARGYLNRPDLTAERFVLVDGERVYRTGDVARWRDDGTLDYLGRSDDQVKVRGYRIELGEIEAALAEHPDVARAAVTVRDDSVGRRLVAYLIPGPGGMPSASALRAHLGDLLPGYMIPALFLAVDDFPLSRNGKLDRRELDRRALDRRALPEPEGPAGSAFVAPRTPVEETLADLWAELLKVKQVGVHDNFFELGGDSLVATRLLATIHEVFDVEFALRTLLEAPTVARMAEAVQNAGRRDGGAGTGDGAVLLRPGDTSRPVFLVHPDSGSPYPYLPLARALDLPHAVIGLEASGLREGGVAWETIGEAARAHVETIRRVQPSGPYLLVGWSVGGQIALEAARILTGRGERALTVMLDSRTAASMETDPEAVAQFEALRARVADADPGPVQRMFRVIVNLVAAARSETMTPYAGPVVLVCAADTDDLGSAGREASWRAVVPDLTVRHSPGDHLTMVKPPHVTALAAVLDEVLGNAFPTTEGGRR